MPLLPRVRSLWNTLVHTERLDRELDEELRAALDTLAGRYRREGLNPAWRATTVSPMDALRSE